MRGAALILSALAPLGLAASDEPPLAPERQAMRERALSGLVVTGKERCISRRRIREVIILSDQRILYRVGASLVYENRLDQDCPGMERSPYLPDYHRSGPLLCEGDLFDAGSIQRRTCSLGPFTVWRAPDSDEAD